MIHDSFDNWQLYFHGELATRIKVEILSAIDNDKAFKKSIIPDKLSIQTMEYSLKQPSDNELIIESHMKFIDIQFTIHGAERIDVFPVPGLDIIKQDELLDLLVYRQIHSSQVTVHNLPGYFTVLFPWDAHRPKIISNQEVFRVFKGVVKLECELFQNRILKH